MSCDLIKTNYALRSIHSKLSSDVKLLKKEFMLNYLIRYILIQSENDFELKLYNSYK